MHESFIRSSSNSDLGAVDKGNAQRVLRLAISQHHEDGIAVEVGDDGLAVVVPAIAIQTTEFDLDRLGSVRLGPEARTDVATGLGIAILGLLEESAHDVGELIEVGDVLELHDLVAGGAVVAAGLDARGGDTGNEGVLGGSAGSGIITDGATVAISPIDFLSNLAHRLL